MPGRTEFSFDFAREQPRQARRNNPEQAMRILLLGDFSGRKNRGLSNQDDLLNRQVYKVDVDNVAAVMARIAPGLTLRFSDPAMPDIGIDLRQLDDFHPDVLLQKLDIFQGLLHLRERLQDPADFAAAAGELRTQVQLTARAADKAQTETPPAVPEDDAETLQRLLGQPSQKASRQAEIKGKNAADDYIRAIVADYVVPEAPPYRDVYLQAVDTAISAKMRMLLQNPDFQALESAWRALHDLVSGIESDALLSLHVLDVAREELFADLSSATQGLQTSAVYRLLVERHAEAFGGIPWAVLAGNYTFACDADDIALLVGMGVLASHAGGPFLAAADPRILGCRSLAGTPDAHDWPEPDPQCTQRWQALRQSPVANWLGLALPRVLMRLPFGRETEELESFDFEEITQAQGHEAFLWGNPAFYCALLLARSFTDSGWDMQPGDDLQIEDLPAYIYQENGESKLLPCAEVCLSENTMVKILDQGLMPFISHRSSNIIRLARFQSLADPAAALAGPWS